MTLGKSPLASLPYGGTPSGLVYPVEPAEWERIMFLSPHASDDAAISASGSLSVNLPVTLVQQMQPSERWRSATVAVDIFLDFAEPVACDTLALMGTNMAGSDAVRVRGYVDAARSSLQVDSVWQPAWQGLRNYALLRNDVFAVRWANSTPVSYWTVSLGVTAGQAYVELGRLMLGKAFQPTINADCSDGFTIMSPAAREITDYGYTYTEDRGKTCRGAVLRFSSMHEEEAFGDMQRIRQLLGNHKDFLVSLQPNRLSGWERTAMQATFDGNADFSPRPMWDGTRQLWATIVQAAEVG